MNRATTLTLAALLLTAATPADEPAGEATSRWRHNARQRTAEAIERLERGESGAALEAFRQALALTPEDPLVQYNAGTGDLLAGAPTAADAPTTTLLETAVEAAPPELRADAFYNLGNARLAAGDAAGAIEAFEGALRAEPGKLDAKHNLELARQMLEQQRRQQESQEESEDPQPSSEPQRENQQQQPGDEEQPSGEKPPQEDPQSGDRQPPDDGRQPLPDFEEQPEMTAEQAAAILEAVENLEREQRRRQALEQRKRAKGDRDW